MFKVERMSGFRISHPYIAIDPKCPPGRHPTRDCRCRVFKTEREAYAYAEQESAR